MADSGRWRLGAGIVFFWAAFAIPAASGEWRYLAGDASESTLDCFGNVNDAECAAETYLACATWLGMSHYEIDRHEDENSPYDLSLCSDYWRGDGFPLGLMVSYGPDARGHLLFRLSEPWVLDEEEAREGKRHVGGSNWYSLHVGDTLFDYSGIACVSSYECNASGRMDCLIDRCIALDGNIESFYSEPSGRFGFPDGIIVLRQENGLWKLVHIHTWRSLNHREDERSWRPLRYRIGPVGAE